MSRINLFINSKHRKSDESSSNFNVNIPNNLLQVKRNEYLELSVISFYTYNTFYQCNNNSNTYQIIIRHQDGSIHMNQELKLPIGNLNVYELLNNISTTYFLTTYDNTINKFTYTRTHAHSPSNHLLYLKPINSGNFFGLNNNVEYLIDFAPTICLYPINVNSIQSIQIGLTGDISTIHNNFEMSNIKGLYKPSDLIFQKAIDVNKNELILYEMNDDSYRYIINNDNIKHFTLSCYNQDGITINDMPDYSLHLQFIINKKDNTEEQNNKIIEYNRENYLILGHIFDIINKLYNIIINFLVKK